MKKILPIIVILSIGIYLLYKVYQFSLAWQESKPLSFEVPKDYIELFRDEFRNKVSSIVTFNSEFREPFSSFILDKRLDVIIYKLRTKGDISLTTFIKLVEGGSSQSKEIIYNNMPQRHYDLKSKSGRVFPVSNILFTLDADSITVINDNSRSIYSCMMRSMSLKYEQNGKVDIIAESNKIGLIETKKILMNIIFFKRGTNIFVMMISDVDEKKILKYNNLESFIKSDTIEKL